MTLGDRSTSAARETNVQLSRLVQYELESVIYDKKRLDERFPLHAKDLTYDHLWAVARARVMVSLCEPWWDEGGDGCGEGSLFLIEGRFPRCKTGRATL